MHSKAYEVSQEYPVAAGESYPVEKPSTTQSQPQGQVQTPVSVYQPHGSQQYLMQPHSSFMQSYYGPEGGLPYQKPNEYLILAVLSCPCNPLLALPAILLALRSREALRNSNEDKALQSGLLALSLAMAAFLSGAILYFFLILYFSIFQAVIYNPWEHEYTTG